MALAALCQIATRYKLGIAIGAGVQSVLEA